MTRPPERQHAVIGQQLADAEQAERRHRAAGHGPSPLEGTGDEQVRAFARRYAGADEAERGRLTAALTMADMYELMTFAHSSVRRSLRGADDRLLDDAATALGAIDEKRVDWRDVAVADALVTWAAQRAGIDTGRKRVRLKDWGHRLVETEEGPDLVGDEGGRFEPKTDLIRLAASVRELIEDDDYEVAGLMAGSKLPDVWLAVTPQVKKALRRVRGAVVMHAFLDPAAGSHADSQQLMAWLVEAKGEDHARTLADAAVPTETFEAIGRHRGSVCCVIVANSWVDEVDSHEQAGALERFGPGLEAALAR